MIYAILCKRLISHVVFVPEGSWCDLAFPLQAQVNMCLSDLVRKLTKSKSWQDHPWFWETVMTAYTLIQKGTLVRARWRREPPRILLVIKLLGCFALKMFIQRSETPSGKTEQAWIGLKLEIMLSLCTAEVISVLLNLDVNSHNAYTMSLFREGVRIAEPQTIPERLHLSESKWKVEWKGWIGQNAKSATSEAEFFEFFEFFIWTQVICFHHLSSEVCATSRFFHTFASAMSQSKWTWVQIYRSRYHSAAECCNQQLDPMWLNPKSLKSGFTMWWCR